MRLWMLTNPKSAGWAVSPETQGECDSSSSKIIKLKTQEKPVL